MGELLLAMLLFSQRPYAHHPRAVENIARTVAQASADPVEQDLLLSLAFTETTWGRPRSVPFGATAGNHCDRTMEEAASDALASIREGLARCGGTVEGAAAHYLSGTCTGRWIVENGERVDYTQRVLRAYVGIKARHNEARALILGAVE